MKAGWWIVSLMVGTGCHLHVRDRRAPREDLPR